MQLTNEDRSWTQRPQAFSGLEMAFGRHSYFVDVDVVDAVVAVVVDVGVIVADVVAVVDAVVVVVVVVVVAVVLL